jgi:hypothetical protein
MYKKQPSFRLLLSFVIAFSMTMPATIIVSKGFEWGSASEFISPGVGAEHRSLVQVDDIIYEVWIEGETHDTVIMFSLSTDNGVTWKTPEIITSEGYLPISVRMSVGSAALHVVWMDAVTRHLRSCYISYDLSVGAWTAPTVLEGENPAITTEGNVVAIATRQQYELKLLLSENNGRLFTPLSPMTGIECTYPSVLLDKGVLHVACIGQTPDEIKGIFYTSSEDLITWGVPEMAVGAEAWMKEISLVPTDGQVSIRWREVTTETIEIYSMEIIAPGLFADKGLVSSEQVVSEGPGHIKETSARLPPKKWTYLCYLDADNNLDSAGYADMDEMEAVGSNLDLNIVVLFDGDTSSGPDTHCFYINPGSRTEIPLTEINPTWTTGELNMGDPQTAIDFVEYVFGEYPAARYLWDMWNHGGSWDWAMCSDDTSGDHLTSLEVRSIYETVRADTGKIKLFDVAGYDECLMADCSVYYDEMPFIDFMCNSEDSIGFDGWEYDLVLGYINSNLDMNGEEAAFWVFQAYVDAWGTSGSVTTMSVINATMLATTLAPAINNLAQKAIHEISTYRSDLQAAASSARSWQGYTHQRDLYHFCELAIASIPVGMVHNALQGVLDAAEANPPGTQYGYPGWQSDRAILIHNQNTNEHGMKIYVNDPPYNSVYDTMTFSDTNWDEFYKVLWGSNPSNPNIEPTVDIVNPLDGGIVVKDSIVTISGTAADDASVQRVDVAVHNQHWAPAIGSTSWTYWWDTTGWEPGWYNIMARAYDGQDYSPVDIHNVLMVDNLPPTVTLLDNNGQAEDGTWTGTETITWTASDPTEDPATLDIQIEYSPNAGGNWYTIEDGVDNNDGNALWNTATVPDGTTYLLRVTVTDQACASVSDESDAVFTITNVPNVDLSSPDGGEAWMGGSTHYIWWNMSDSGGNPDTLTVDLYYSTNSGATYPNAIATGLTGFIANPCSYLWDPVPYLDFTTVKVKAFVSDPFPHTSEDTSQNDFAIDSTAPAPATNARAELEGLGVRIYWNPSASADVDHYEVFYVMNAWDSSGDSYSASLNAGLNTDILHSGVGINSAQSYFYQIRTYDMAGYETRTTIQAAKYGKTLSYLVNPSGWFILGSPLVQSDTSLNHVIQGQNFPTGWDYAMSWNPNGVVWNSYLKGRPNPLNDLADISNEMGFWLHVTGNARWTTAGYITDMAVPMKAGWNLVPYAFAARSMSASAVESQLTANCAGFDSWEIFDQTAAYRLKIPTGSEPLAHGDAFWVHVSVDCTWNVINY